MPCCDDPAYITSAREASKYIYIRENALEWNAPQIAAAKGDCCGVSLCRYRIQDNVKVIYFDDLTLEDIDDDTRCCNDLRTKCCGGMGEEIRLRGEFCLGMCVRAPFPIMCVPACCPTFCCPCAFSHSIYVENSNEAIVKIKNAVDNSKQRMNMV